MRFVQVWTLKRGKIDPPELLDDADQWRVFSAWREDVSREARAEFELSETVVWNSWEIENFVRTGRMIAPAGRLANGPRGHAKVLRIA